MTHRSRRSVTRQVPGSRRAIPVTEGRVSVQAKSAVRTRCRTTTGQRRTPVGPPAKPRYAKYSVTNALYVNIPASGGPGQQAAPRPIRAMPHTRATGIATPFSCSPNTNCPTIDGTDSNANPVVASPIAAKRSTFFICDEVPVLPLAGRSAGTPRCCRSPPRIKFVGQIVDLAGELERHVVAVLQKRQRRARVLSDIERLVLREGDRCGVLH